MPQGADDLLADSAEELTSLKPKWVVMQMLCWHML